MRRGDMLGCWRCRVSCPRASVVQEGGRIGGQRIIELKSSLSAPHARNRIGSFSASPRKSKHRDLRILKQWSVTLIQRRITVHRCKDVLQPIAHSSGGESKDRGCCSSVACLDFARHEALHVSHSTRHMRELPRSLMHRTVGPGPSSSPSYSVSIAPSLDGGGFAMPTSSMR